MFFVGATGQLLTLILTVCLPFVFLMSGQSKVEVQSPAIYISIHQNHQEVSLNEISNYDINTDFVQEENSIHFNFDEYSSNPKFPHERFRVKWKSIYSKSSGNKAPPVFHCFSC